MPTILQQRGEPQRFGYFCRGRRQPVFDTETVSSWWRNLPFNGVSWRLGADMFSAVAVLALLVPGSPASVPEAVDSQIRNYYQDALASAGAEPHKALAMLELLLLPSRTSIHVDWTGVPLGVKRQFEAGIRRGVMAWEQALGAECPFALGGSTDGTATIHIRFVDALASPDPHTKGELRITRRITWGKSVHYTELDGQIRVMKWARDGQYFTEDEITHVIAHELGHALGLGDSDRWDRVMGPIVIGQPYARISPEELLAVQQFRAVLKEEYARISAAAERSAKGRPAVGGIGGTSAVHRMDCRGCSHGRP
jgi:hypothetical protein